MISRIEGKVKQKKENCLLIDVHGICYEVLIPPTVMHNIEKKYKQDEILSLFTFHYHQVEPSRNVPVLIGFLNEIEREFFERFISVSGVGPKTAVKALNMPISRIARAIDEGDTGVLSSLPGIGSQRAKEIIAKLQGKIGKYGLIQDDGSLKEEPSKENIREEALEILSQLQYKRHEAEKMIQQALLRNPGIKTTEELLNEAYRQRISK
ncbi:MAG: Holliday junction ATP-dependent DNA helicase RuvA [Candidatus Omnitrophica bacterium]|nr:Holliday junction ATP-dependent DNA helicase RuvA [Candidatus Omnitrophota bacterium]